ncbi:MAG: hypothetical protein ACI9G1_005585 [Pirellulaceae bacterium]|jgi:hypothetical protein
MRFPETQDKGSTSGSAQLSFVTNAHIVPQGIAQGLIEVGPC